MQTVNANMPVIEKEGVNTLNEEVSLQYLFFTFFKIGLISFGGHMALISVIQRIMVEKDRTVSSEAILNSIGIASLLPGPLAVNVVGQTGYNLRGAKGAVLSIIGIILPAFLLMLALSWTYFTYQQTINWQAAMSYVAGAVSAIILASGLQLYVKEVKGNITKIIICFSAIVILILTSNYLMTVAMLVAGAVLGVMLKVQSEAETDKNSKSAVISGGLTTSPAVSISSKFVVAFLLINQLLFLSNTSKYISSGYLKILLIFSGISLTLFGGGYVMIPIMQILFVNDLHWLNNKEFVDAIAFSQATPGPILISATFIGYKVAGFGGALLATIAIFTPSAFVVIIVSKVISKYQNNGIVKNLMGGIKTVVVALIIVSAYKIVAHETFGLLMILTIVVSFVLNFKYKISPVYLIVGAILLGVAKNLI
ncbi:MAG: hypothetical protein JWQ25_2247 [Daejeonella sp.]|nr:hypothetical protein [Daejeonella sp.]